MRPRAIRTKPDRINQLTKGRKLGEAFRGGALSRPVNETS